MKNLFGEHITIEVVQGGFILTYPVISASADGSDYTEQAREVFVSPRKLNQKIKEVIDAVGLVTDGKNDK